MMNTEMTTRSRALNVPIAGRSIRTCRKYSRAARHAATAPVTTTAIENSVCGSSIGDMSAPFVSSVRCGEGGFQQVGANAAQRRGIPGLQDQIDVDSLVGEPAGDLDGGHAGRGPLWDG